MLKFFKQLVVSSALVLSSYFRNTDGRHSGDPTELSELDEELEPVRAMDDFDKWFHHDDVTPEEEEMLFSNDPEKILEAHQAITERQEHVNEIYHNKELLRAMIQEPWVKPADMNQEQKPTEEMLGWEDDDELPETFIGYNEDGDLEEIRFDDLPEWQHGKNT